MLTPEQVQGRNTLFEHLKATLSKEYTLPDKPKGTLVEIGTGIEGGYIECYTPHFQRSVAVDLDDYSANYDGVEFVVSDGLTIPLSDRTADLVVSHSALEHVANPGVTIAEINRILKIGGHAFLTVSPLYYSYCGGHWGQEAFDWQHLDPTHKLYIDDRNVGEGGHFLNKLTVSQLLAEVGKQPWDILRLERVAHYTKQLPAFLAESPVPKVDLLVREFRLVIVKHWDVIDGQVSFRND